MCPTGWRCSTCQSLDSQRDHHCEDKEMNEVTWLFREIINAVDVWGIEEGHIQDIPIGEGDDESDEDYDPKSEGGSKSDESEDESLLHEGSDLDHEDDSMDNDAQGEKKR